MVQIRVQKIFFIHEIEYKKTGRLTFDLNYLQWQIHYGK